MASEENGASHHFGYADDVPPEFPPGYPVVLQEDDDDKPPVEFSGHVDFAFNIQMKAVDKESMQEFGPAYELYKRHISESFKLLQRKDYADFKTKYDQYISERLEESGKKRDELELKLGLSVGSETSLQAKLQRELYKFKSTNLNEDEAGSGSHAKQLEYEEFDEDEEFEEDDELKEDVKWKDEEDYKEVVVYQRTGATKVPTVKVLFDQIEIVEADAIAVTTNPRLTLNVGSGLSQLIYDRGGEEIQEELYKNFMKELKPGEAVKSTSGRMTNCVVIYHGYLPYFLKEKSGKCYQALFDLVNNILRLATGDGLKTLAMIAFGTGNLGYDEERVTRIMFQAVIGFVTKNSSSLETIKLVITPKSSPLLKKHFLLEQCSNKLKSREVTDLPKTFKDLESDSNIIHEERFVMKHVFLQVTNGNFEQVKDMAETMIIIWNPDHVYRKREHPIISCFDESTQKNIHMQYGLQLKRKDLQFARDDTSLPGTQLIHVRCDSDSDDDVTKALVNGLKLIKDNNPRTAALLVKTDGSRPWQPHIAAKIITEAVKERQTQHSIVRIVILDKWLYIPFLTAIRDLCRRLVKPKIQQLKG